jgi:uncharacterized membrane protein
MEAAALAERTARLRVKTAAVTAVVILSNVLGNLMLAGGMRRVGSPETPLAYVESLFDPQVALGVALLIVWMLSHMVLLSWADLSYVLPVTSVGYVLAALAGYWFLGEQISVARWMGIGLIAGGVSLVARTPPATAPVPGERS